MGDKIRVLIVDDHAVLRAGLRMLLNTEPDMLAVGEAADGEEAIQKTKELNPDVVLLDISMQNMGGIESIKKILAQAPKCRPLILTMHDDQSFLRHALAEGAAGYVLKHAADTELLTAIRAVHQGGIYLNRLHAQRLVDGKQETETLDGSEPLSRLSERELEVLNLVAKGYTNQQAADQLYLSIKTVETYKARLMNKLGFHTRAELVRYAMQNGLMD